MPLVARLKAAAPGTPIIVMTAFGSAEIEAQARQNGAAAYLSKHFPMVELKTNICRLLGRNRGADDNSSG